MFCSNCGTNNPEGSVFCENCGQKLEVVPTQDSHPLDSMTSTPDKPLESALQFINIGLICVLVNLAIALATNLNLINYDSYTVLNIISELASACIYFSLFAVLYFVVKHIKKN